MKSSDNTLLLVGLFVLIVVIIALIVYYTRPGESKTPDQTSGTTELKIENLSLTRTLNPDPSVGNGVSGYTIEPYGIEYDTGKADYNELSKNVTFTMNWTNAPGFTAQKVKGFKIEHFVKPEQTDAVPTPVPVRKQDLIKQKGENTDDDKDNISITDFGACRAKIVSNNTYSVIGQNSFKLYAVVKKNETTDIDWDDTDTQEYVLLYDGTTETPEPVALTISQNQLSVTLEMTTPDSLTFTPSGFEASTRAVISKTTYNVSSTQGDLTKPFPGYSGGVYLTTLPESGGKRFYFTFEDGFILMLNSDGRFSKKLSEDGDDEIFIFEIVDREKTVGKIRQAASRFLGDTGRSVADGPVTIPTSTAENDRKYLSTNSSGKLKLYKQQDSDLTATIFAGFEWTFNERISKNLPFPTGETGGGGDVVCIYGDDAFIGQPRFNSSRGRVLIYKRNSTGKWEYMDKIDSGSIQGIDPTPECKFGASISITDDYAVIGEPGRQEARGMAFVIKRGNVTYPGGKVDPRGWPKVGSTNADVTRIWFGNQITHKGRRLGSSVSIDGNNLIIGGPGKRYISLHTSKPGGNIWTKKAEITRASGSNSNGYGTSVSIYGNTCIVGAPDSNKVFIYEINPNASGSNVAYLGLKGIITGDSKSGDTNVWFGASVAIQDDVAVVGAPGYNNKKGAVYVFKRGTTTNMADANSGEGGGWRMDYAGLNHNGGTDSVGDAAKTKGYTEARIDGTDNEELGRAIGISGNKLITGSGISNKVRVYTRTQKTPSSRHRWNDVNCFNVDYCASLTKARVFEPPPKRYNDSNLKFGTAVSIDGDYAMIGEPGRYFNDEDEDSDVGAAYITTV